jgi:quinol-cytochrome oxidoreductase complex cytochrome b subunit
MWALVWAPAAVIIFLAAVPLVDRGSVSRTTVTLLRIAGLALFLATLALGLWAALAPPQQHLGM